MICIALKRFSSNSNIGVTNKVMQAIPKQKALTPNTPYRKTLLRVYPNFLNFFNFHERNI